LRLKIYSKIGTSEWKVVFWNGIFESEKIYSRISASYVKLFLKKYHPKVIFVIAFFEGAER